MMNPILNYLLTGAAIAAEIGLLGLLMSTRKDLRRHEARRVIELAETHDVVMKMRAEIDELAAELRERDAVPIQSARRIAINLHPRAEALRMLRRGSDEHTVSETLNLPPADVALLRKVSQILCAAKGSYER